MQIALDAPQQTVSVPLDALRRDLEGHTFVWRVDKGEAGALVVHRNDVTPGTEDAQRVAIAKGLGAGARVVVLGGVDLADGMTVAEVHYGPEGPAEMPSPSASSAPGMKDMPGMQSSPSAPSPQPSSHAPSPSAASPAGGPSPTSSMPPMPGMP